MRWLASILTWLAADPATLDAEHAKAAAAVTLARATMERESDAEKDSLPSANPQPREEAAGTGRQQPAVSSGAGLLQPGAPGVAEGCPDGRCVDVQSVRKTVQRR